MNSRDSVIITLLFSLLNKIIPWQMNFAEIYCLFYGIYVIRNIDLIKLILLFLVSLRTASD